MLKKYSWTQAEHGFCQTLSFRQWVPHFNMADFLKVLYGHTSCPYLMFEPDLPSHPISQKPTTSLRAHFTKGIPCQSLLRQEGHPSRVWRNLEHKDAFLRLHQRLHLPLLFTLISLTVFLFQFVPSRVDCVFHSPLFHGFVPLSFYAHRQTSLAPLPCPTDPRTVWVECDSSECITKEKKKEMAFVYNSEEQLLDLIIPFSPLSSPRLSLSLFFLYCKSPWHFISHKRRMCPFFFLKKNPRVKKKKGSKAYCFM